MNKNTLIACVVTILMNASVNAQTLKNADETIKSPGGFVIYTKENTEGKLIADPIGKVDLYISKNAYVVTTKDGYEIKNYYLTKGKAPQDFKLIKNGGSVDVSLCGSSHITTNEKGKKAGVEKGNNQVYYEYIYSWCQSGTKTPIISPDDLDESLLIQPRNYKTNPIIVPGSDRRSNYAH